MQNPIKTPKPIINSLLALLYIVFVSILLYSGTMVRLGNNSFLIPVAMLSLFTFSAAVMAYLFLYQPFVLYFDGHKKQALNFFLKTLSFFGIATILLFLILLIVKL